MKRLVAAVALCIAVTGCSSSSPQAVLQDRANAVVAAANAGDVASLRAAASLLLRDIDAQESQADLGAAKARALRSLVNRILANSGLLAPVETTPTPTPTPSVREPSPTPTPSAAPSPSQRSPSAEPPPSSQPPSVLPSVIVGDPSPQPSPSAS